MHIGEKSALTALAVLILLAVAALLDHYGIQRWDGAALTATIIIAVILYLAWVFYDKDRD